MRLTTLTLFGALLAAPLFSQNTAALLAPAVPPASSTIFGDPVVTSGGLEWFRLSESRADIQRLLGAPKTVEPLGDLESWQYQIDVHDTHDFSHLLVFRKSTGELVSVTRNFEEERSVDEWFPAAETNEYPFPDQPSFKVRLRKLPGGRILMAMGAAGPDHHTGQVVLIRESELRNFHPWIKLR